MPCTRFALEMKYANICKPALLVYSSTFRRFAVIALHTFDMLIITRTTAITPPTLEDTREWLRKRPYPSKFYFVALLMEDNVPRERWKRLGAVGCSRGTPEIGYGFHDHYWGRGYATEAINGFLELYWRFVPSREPKKDEVDVWKDVEGPRPLLGVHDHVEARTDAENLGSRKVLEKCGFRCIGTRPKVGEECPSPEHGGDVAMYRMERPN